jgi:hypothetical protein
MPTHSPNLLLVAFGGSEVEVGKFLGNTSIGTQHNASEPLNLFCVACYLDSMTSSLCVCSYPKSVGARVTTQQYQRAPSK